MTTRAGAVPRLWGERGRNTAFAVAVSIVVAFLAWVIFSDSWNRSGLVRTLAVSLIYALPMVFFWVLVLPLLRARIDSLPPPWDWAAFLLALGLLSAAAITISSGWMVLARLANPANPWPELKLVSRLAFDMCLLFSIGARTFDLTRERLEQRTRALQEEVAADARQLKLQAQEVERAREMQEALFPKVLPKLTACEVAAGCQPARIVGGDYFNVIRIGDERLAIAIADVVGKGIAAALLMSNLQAIVRSFAGAGLSTAELCAKANEVIAGNIGPGKFITFFYAVVDTRNLLIDYCNAGHNPPLLVRADARVERLTEGGPLIGVFANALYASGTATLSRGDTLVLFTDGITEASNASGEEFGDARVIELVWQGDAAEATRKRIMEAVLGFCGDSLQDDATIVVLTASGAGVRAARA